VGKLKYCKNLAEINYYCYYTKKAVEFHLFLLSALEGVYLQAPAALLPGKEILFPLNGRLGVSQSQSGRLVEKKNSLVSTGIRTAAHPSP
jgi:hypothetical protein